MSQLTRSDRSAGLSLTDVSGYTRVCIGCIARKGVCTNVLAIEGKHLADIEVFARVLSSSGWRLSVGSAKLPDGGSMRVLNPVCGACANAMRQRAGVIWEPSQHKV